MRTLAAALMWSLVPPPRAALRSSHTRSAEEHDKGIKNVSRCRFGWWDSFFLSSLTCRSLVITDIWAVPTEPAAKSSASQRCPALLAVILNTISGSFRRRRGKHSHSGQFAPRYLTRLPPVIVKDDKGEPCVGPAGDAYSKTTRWSTFVLVPNVQLKLQIFESTLWDCNEIPRLKQVGVFHFSFN